MVEPVDELHDLASGVTLHVRRWEPPGAHEAGLPSWVLTHGLASNARLWDGVAWRLAAMGHLVVTVDQRGHGLSSKPEGPYDVATCADDLALLIDVLDLDRPAVAGQSWGGNVVLELGHRHPGAVALVTCVDGGFIELGARFADWERCAEALAPPKLAGTPLETMRGWLDRSASDWPEEGREGTLANFEVRADGTIAPWLTFERHLEVLHGLWEHSPAAVYPDVDVPTLLIAADTGDVGWTDSKESAVDAAVAALPRGRAHWFRPAHHDVHAQRPDEVADLLHDAATDPDFFPPPDGSARRASAGDDQDDTDRDDTDHHDTDHHDTETSR
ncbi:alpha/beta fold hydrolase [Ilumatobacter sp.]|uniref:alpha/beta fold hydrolase n=1 Tax=Ilumatobacter sp. TaxID=1967498 RepID=UPI003B52A344